jgi:hypothetical protein
METIRASLTGNDRDEHVFSLRQSLELYDTYQSKIAECDRVLEASMAALSAVSAFETVGGFRVGRISGSS